MRCNQVAFLTLMLLGALPGTCTAAEESAATGQQRDTLLYVRTDPPGATLIYNGKELGLSNGLFRVEPGPGTLKVRPAGGGEIEKSVTIRAHAITRVEVELGSQPGAPATRRGLPLAKGESRPASKSSAGPPPEQGAQTAGAREPLSIVNVVPGATFFQPGDLLQITEVRASSPALKAGDTVVVHGRYKLATATAAKISFFCTAVATGSGRSRVMPEQQMSVTQGEGAFVLTQVVPYDGFLHVTFYRQPGGTPFGGTYFGTAAQMDTQRRDSQKWDISRRYSQ